MKLTHPLHDISELPNSVSVLEGKDGNHATSGGGVARFSKMRGSFAI